MWNRRRKFLITEHSTAELWYWQGEIFGNSRFLPIVSWLPRNKMNYLWVGQATEWKKEVYNYWKSPPADGIIILLKILLMQEDLGWYWISLISCILMSPKEAAPAAKCSSTWLIHSTIMWKKRVIRVILENRESWGLMPKTQNLQNYIGFCFFEMVRKVLLRLCWSNVRKHFLLK